MISSLNDGFHMEPRKNVALLCNVPVQPFNINDHAMLSLCTMLYKHVLFDNFNGSVSQRKIRKVTSVVTVPLFSMLVHWFNKLVLRVSLKIL